MRSCYSGLGLPAYLPLYQHFHAASVVNKLSPFCAGPSITRCCSTEFRIAFKIDDFFTGSFDTDLGGLDFTGFSEIRTTLKSVADRNISASNKRIECSILSVCSDHQCPGSSLRLRRNCPFSRSLNFFLTAKFLLP